MARGGARPGAGRPKKQVDPEYDGPEIRDFANLTPYTYWLAILRDPRAPHSWRLMASDKLAPLMHARIAPKQLDAGQGDLLMIVDESGAPVAQAGSPFIGLPGGVKH